MDNYVISDTEEDEDPLLPFPSAILEGARIFDVNKNTKVQSMVERATGLLKEGHVCYFRGEDEASAKAITIVEIIKRNSEDVTISEKKGEAEEIKSDEATNASEEDGEPSYDKTSSFFDRISCEALEKAEGKKSRPDWRKERETNQESFGHQAVRSLNYRRGFGRGMRGGPQNGGGRYNNGFNSYNNGGYNRGYGGGGAGGSRGGFRRNNQQAKPNRHLILFQWNEMALVKKIQYWNSLVEGLSRLKVAVQKPSIFILLSTVPFMVGSDNIQCTLEEDEALVKRRDENKQPRKRTNDNNWMRKKGTARENQAKERKELVKQLEVASVK